MCKCKVDVGDVIRNEVAQQMELFYSLYCPALSELRTAFFKQIRKDLNIELEKYANEYISKRFNLSSENTL